MKKKSESAALKEAITLLKSKQALQLQELKDQFHLTLESVQPINLIKNTFQDAASSPGVKSSILNSAIGLTTGYLSKRVLLGAALNPATKILGMLLQFAVARIVTSNAGTIKSTGQNLLHLFSRSRKQKQKEIADKEPGSNGLAH